MKRKRKRRLKRKLIAFLCVLLLLLIGGLGYLFYEYRKGNETTPYYLSADHSSLILKDKDGNEKEFTRGSLVNIKNRRVKIDEIEYCQFVEDGVTYYVLEDVLVNNRRDAVLEKSVYALRDHVLSKEPGDYHISGFVKKKQLLNITGFNELLAD